jgi:hypothetical protein
MRREFVLHLPTDRVGIVIEIWRSGAESCQTIRLAGGEMVCAPSGDFRPATVMEIDKRHRAAAWQRPLVLPPAVGFDRHAG